MGRIAYPLHPGSYREHEHEHSEIRKPETDGSAWGDDEIWTYISPWFGHKARHDAVFHTHALDEILEKDGVVCHSSSVCVSQSRLVHTRSRFGI